jgi:hypothetical protein
VGLGGPAGQVDAARRESAGHYDRGHQLVRLEEDQLQDVFSARFKASAR